MAPASDDPGETGRDRGRSVTPNSPPVTPRIPPADPHIPLGGTATPVVRGPRRSRSGTIGVGAVLIAAGLLFTTSAHTSHGTQLRSQRADLADLLESENTRVHQRTLRVAALNDQVKAEAAAAASSDAKLRSLTSDSAGVEEQAGLVAVSGPGLRITLDDAPPDAPVPAQAGPDDLVVHQQDVQAVVNALWAGGAEAMMLMDQRVISTSAVRCVGNTLILQGQVYSPPYRITAIGDVDGMKAAVGASPQIGIYLQYVASLRLGWKVEAKNLAFPAYQGSLTLSHAQVARVPKTAATPGNGSSQASSGASPQASPQASSQASSP